MGGRSIACINARDRNILGFQRDLLTAAAYGVNEFLFVYGDRPETGARSDDLTVKSMIAEARAFAERTEMIDSLRIGVATGLRPIPAWKQGADFLLTQVTYSIDDLLGGARRSSSTVRSTRESWCSPVPRWLASCQPTYPSWLSPRRSSVSSTESWIGRGHRLRSHQGDLRVRGFDGVHLIPVNRYREMAARLNRCCSGTPTRRQVGGSSGDPPLGANRGWRHWSSSLVTPAIRCHEAELIVALLEVGQRESGPRQPAAQRVRVDRCERIPLGARCGSPRCPAIPFPQTCHQGQAHGPTRRTRRSW